MSEEMKKELNAVKTRLDKIEPMLRRLLTMASTVVGDVSEIKETMATKQDLKYEARFDAASILLDASRPAGRSVSLLCAEAARRAR